MPKELRLSLDIRQQSPTQVQLAAWNRAWKLLIESTKAIKASTPAQEKGGKE